MEAQGGQQQWMMSAQAQPHYAYGAPPPPPQPYHQPSSHEEIRTLWIGDLPYWADESYLHSWFTATIEVLSIKVIRNKATGLPEGYGFVEFASHSTAERVLQSYNGTQIPGTDLTFRLNWASPEHSTFVRDLAPDVTDHLLQETFRTQYPSVSTGIKSSTQMNWLLQTEDPRIQYQSNKTYMDFPEELSYEHVNLIFSDATYPQESAINTSAYKFGYSEAGRISYHDYCDDYPIHNQTMGNNEYTRQLDPNQMTTTEHTRQDEQLSSSFRANPAECPESNNHHHVWEDNVDIDNMTYEELIELGEIVGSQSRGLSQDAISLLPVSKFKFGLCWRNFSKKKSRDEKCVICQMEYKRGDRQITLPCKHVYHAACGSRWLSINKVCPVCYKDVQVDVCPSKREERFDK